jgi:type II secretory pathway pseudopilin PulG
VELLVVIAIIAMLAALITPAVMQALSSARNAAIKSEIDMLHMAIMNYKSEYGVLPPCFDNQFNATPAGSYKAGGEAAKHLKRLFPRCPDTAGQLNAVSLSPAGSRIPLEPLSALTAWLSGYTTDPQSPLFGKRQKLYDFDTSRVNPFTGAYFPSGKRNSPYIYIDAAKYLTVTTTGTFATPFPHLSNTYFAQRLPVPVFSIVQWDAPTQPAFNPDTFQILSAGRDEIFGNEDDLSNFWPSTRGDYLQSLKQ